jgi:hypothetical protein
MVFAFVSRMDSIITFPAEFLTATEIASVWTSMPTYFVLSILVAPSAWRSTLKTYLKGGALS